MESLRSELMHDVQHFIFEARDGVAMKKTLSDNHHTPQQQQQQQQHWWDLYGLQGMIDWDRCDGVDFNASVRDTEQRDEVHAAMLTVGTRGRYLKETQVLQALHESMFELISCPENRRSFSLFNSLLFRYILRVRDEVSDFTIEDNLFHPARVNRIIAWNNVSNKVIYDDDQNRDKRNKSNVPTVNRSSLEYIAVDGLPSRMDRVVGIYGLNRVMIGLGVNADRIFFNLWRIPPFLANIPQYCDVYCGISLQTALLWCKPRMHRLYALQKVQAAVESSHRAEVPDNRVDPYFEYHVDKKKSLDGVVDEKKNGVFGGIFGRKKTKAEKLKKDRRRISVGAVVNGLGSVDDRPSAVKASKYCDSDDDEFKLDGDNDKDMDLGTLPFDHVLCT